MANDPGTPAPRTIGPYLVGDPAVRGSAGVTFHATDPRTQRHLHVRLLSARFAASPEAVERFERDAVAAARLDHPNLVKVLDHGMDGERPWVATDPTEGQRLSEVLRGRRLELKEAISLWKEILKGLAHAHQHGVIHRDLHPGAVVVSADLSRVKLTDFGMGRIEALTGTTGTIATSELSLGTLQYLAPEQAEGKNADVRSDVYAAGAILHELLTGRPPGGRFALPSQLNAELPADVDVLVLKCMAKNPTERYGTLVHLMGDLEKLEETLRFRLLGELQGISRSTSRLLGKGERDAGAAPAPAEESAKKSPVALWVGLGIAAVVIVVVLVFVL